MKTIEIVVLEAGLDYLDKVESFQMEVPGNKEQAVAKVIEAVKDRGYQVLHNDQGGNNEYIRVDCDEEYIAVTVVPSVEEGEE
jgi:predicted metallopeptidase